MNSERKSRILVTVVDGVKLSEDVKKKIDKASTVPLPVDSKFSQLLPRGAYGFVKTKEGTFFFDNDGCGDRLPIEKRPPSIDLYVHKENTIELVHSVMVEVNPSNIGDLPVTGKINLTHFIRSFGNRLECNFNEWNKFLESAEPLGDYLEKVPATT